jgi:hypothetical protein
VVRKHCKCHGPECPHPATHNLRQYDYLENDEIDPVNPIWADKVNKTTKV